MARRYETVYIFDPALEEPAITERLERFHALLTKDAKGSITNVAHWGKRTLSYPIKKKDTGYYVVAQFETAAELLPEYERAVKLEEGVVRVLVDVGGDHHGRGVGLRRQGLRHDDQGPHHPFLELHRALVLGQELRGGLELGDHVVARVLLLDRVGESALTPVGHVRDRALGVLGQERVKPLQAFVDRGLFQRRIEDVNGLVATSHATSLWS